MDGEREMKRGRVEEREIEREQPATERVREREGGRKRRKQTSDREVQRGMQEEYTDKETKM